MMTMIAGRTMSVRTVEEMSPAVIEIPMEGDRVLVAIYLLPHPDVERALVQHGWRRIPIVAPGPDATL